MESAIAPYLDEHTILRVDIQVVFPFYIEMHPALAVQLGVVDGDWVTAESRRGNTTLRALVVKTIRPDTIFIPYHWAGRKSANQLTISAQDPISKIPEYKVCAVRVKKAVG